MTTVAAAELLPDPELPLVSGGTAKISDYAGKKLVVLHFASW